MKFLKNIVGAMAPPLLSVAPPLIHCNKGFFFIFDNLIATTMKVREFIQTLIILIEESSQCL